MKNVVVALLVMLASTANAEGIKKVEPGTPHFNEDGTVTVEALVTDEAGQREQCVFTMIVERGEKDGSATTKLVEKSSVCTPTKS